MKTTPPEQPVADLIIESLMTAVLGAAVIVGAAPLLLVAVPVAFVIDTKSWPRWPAAVIGALLTALTTAAGGLDRYRSVWLKVAHNLHHQLGVPWHPAIGLVPLAIAGGVAGAPALLWWHQQCGSDDLARHQRRETERRRCRLRATRVAQTTEWPVPADRTVLGLRIDGDIADWGLTRRRHRFVAPPVEIWGRQALIVGETGSGKTVTALALAAESLRLGRHVYWIDAKADSDTAQQFLANAAHLGVSARNGLTDPIDGWRGGPEAVINRLLATQHFTEPYYEGIARAVLQNAFESGPIRSLTELNRRLAKPVTKQQARRPSGLVGELAKRELIGVRARYEGIGWAVGSHLDGNWSYEDTQAAYIPVGRPENRNQAGEIGAFILEDLLHWALTRKPREQRALVIVDEFSKLSNRPGAAVDLVERARSYGVGVILIGQTWHSLGPDETTRNRIAGTVGTIICHQLKQPDKIAGLAGTEHVSETTRQVRDGIETGLGSQRGGNQYIVRPDRIRRLHRGEAYLIHQGAAVNIQTRGPRQVFDHERPPRPEQETPPGRPGRCWRVLRIR